MEKEKKQKNKGKTVLFSSLIIILIIIFLVLAYIYSPRVYSITTALYNQSTEEDQKNVETAMGKDNTEERFRLYFQYFNVIHELGHGLIYYNDGVKIDVADEEQLVNDFAVAYWKYYGEEEKVKELENIVNYAANNIVPNNEKGVDYLTFAKNNSIGRNFNTSFFNFNDYGWFQFSCVKHSFETNKSLEDVLKEMGFENFNIGDKRTLTYNEINEDESTKIINDAVENFKSWGLEFPKTKHHFDKNPNNNYSRSMVNYLGLFEVIDWDYVFTYLV